MSEFSTDSNSISNSNSKSKSVNDILNVANTNNEEIIENTCEIKNWRQGEILGAGNFGKVYKGIDLDTNQWLAIKVVMVDSQQPSIMQK